MTVVRPIARGLCILLLTVVANGGQDAADEPRLQLQTAVDEATGRPIRRGVFRVPENRSTRDGRVLELDLVVLPAMGPDPRPDPIVVLAGGPGVAAATQYRAYVDSPLRDDRDIVLLSQRGTGGENRLDCPCGTGSEPQRYLDPLFDQACFRDCLERLRQQADLRWYTTPVAMDDLDELRSALGVERINLFGGSYGTRAALVYMRRHPEAVRTAVLNGVAPIEFVNPLFHARAAQDALDAIAAECAADPTCHERFGDLRRKLDVILNRLTEWPARVEVRDPRDDGPVEIELTRAALAEMLRIAMYRNNRIVPLAIDEAFHGDYRRLAQLGLDVSWAVRNAVAFGMLLCVTCSEDVARIDPGDIPRLTDGTFLGDGRVRRQMAVCALWPKGEVPVDYGQPVRCDAPTLLLSGALDPVTTPAMGELAARNLANGLHLVVPGGAHGVGGDCIDGIVREFLDRGTIVGLDTACVEAIEIGPFAGLEGG